MDDLRARWGDRGFFTRGDALGVGYLDRDLTRMVRNRSAVRFRRGAYAFADQWQAMAPVQRHTVRTRAVLQSMDGAVAASHVSGMVLHGIDVWDVPLDRVHVTRLDSSTGRYEGDVVHHEGAVTDADVVDLDGRAVMSPQRCALEAASRVDGEHALALLDAGLRAQAFDLDQMAQQFATMAHWPFVQHLQIVARLADGRAGSVGESRGRYLMFRLGIPAPVLQYEVRRRDGTLIGVTDWAWPEHRLLGEFDGRIKYGRLLRPGQSPGDVVYDEKLREDELREETGFAMIRFTWQDYEDLPLFDSRLRRALGIRR